MYKIKALLRPSEYGVLMSGFNIDCAQEWVEKVKVTIGLKEYDRIKSEFIKEQDSKTTGDSEMHCIPKRRVVTKSVLFKRDIGASRELRREGDDFVKVFTDIVYGVREDSEVISLY